MSEEQICEECENETSECDCCTECLKSSCECCNDCGNPPDSCEGYCWRCDSHKNEWGLCQNCDYCEECGETKEYCGGCREEFGTSHRPPWEDRGIKIDATTNKTKWELIWPEIDQSVDPLQSAADFYILESISAGVAAPIPGVNVKPVILTQEKDDNFFEVFNVTDETEKQLLIEARNSAIRERREKEEEFNLACIKGQAQLILEDLVEYLDPVFVGYSHMAVSGELRHHVAMKSNILSPERASAWCGWRKIYDKVGNQALLDAAELFYEFTGGGYGGPPWANCAEVLYQRLEGKLGPDGPSGKINKRMFIDRIWTLEHNGGCFLNKINWSIKNKKGRDISWMRSLLDCHASDPPDYKTLLKMASEEVFNLFFEYLESSNKLQERYEVEKTVIEFVKWAEPKKVCLSCYSDVTIGHRANCSYVTSSEFNKDDHPEMWVQSFWDEDDFNEASFAWSYNKTETDKANGNLLYDENGNVTLPPDKKLKAKLEMFVTDSNRGQQFYTSERELTFLELMTSNKEKWHIKRFGKNLPTPLGEVYDYSYTVTISFKSATSSKEYSLLSVHHYSYGEKASIETAKPIVLNELALNKFKDKWSISNLEGEKV